MNEESKSKKKMEMKILRAGTHRGMRSFLAIPVAEGMSDSGIRKNPPSSDFSLISALCCTLLEYMYRHRYALEFRLCLVLT